MKLNAKQLRQFDKVCKRIAEGMSLMQVTKAGDVPSYTTIGRWLLEDGGGGMRAKYALAREAQAEHHADEIVTIADDQNIDPNSRRIMVDARKWIASKLKPRVYGDKIDHKHSGSLTIGIRQNDRIDD